MRTEENYCRGMSRKEYSKAYFRDNKERLLEAARIRNRAAYAANPERYKAVQAAWKQANPERRAAHRNGVDPNTVPKRPEACEVCGAHPTHRQPLQLDHCHERSVFRGWLCKHCNATLGLAQDDADRLRKLAAYLESR